MRMLSIHSLGHDTSVSVFDDGVLRCTIETERLTRVKHDHRVKIALEYVFENIPIKAENIDMVVVSTNIRSELLKIKDYESAIQKIEKGCLHYETECKMLGINKPCIIVAHEASHAALAWHYSGYQRNCLILVNEGHGTFSRNSLYFTKNDKINLVEYDSLPWYATGFGWSALGYFFGLGIGPSIAGTVMAYSGYGNYKEEYREIIESFDRNIHFMDRCQQKTRFKKFINDFGGKAKFQKKANLVKTFQKMFNNEILYYIKSKAADLCAERYAFGGGCSLNIITNTYLKDSIGPLSIAPACNDAGQSLGAAIYVYKCLLGTSTKHFSPYSNGLLERKEANELFKKRGLECKSLDLDSVAHALADGAIVAYMDGISEIGPRALGNRSLLANPAIKGMKKRLSEKTKNREWFRPLSPIMTDDAFEKLYPNEPKSPYMLYNYENRCPLLVEACHNDNTMRIQSLSKELNPRLHHLLELFESITGVPGLINTSLNVRGNAIAFKVDDMLDDFLDSEVDLFVAYNCVAKNSKI